MVQIRSILENLSNKELIEGFIMVDEISTKLSGLSNRFYNFLRRFEFLSLNFISLVITRNCNRLLTKRVIQLERNAVTNAQYHMQESVEVKPVPASISDEELGLNICKALSLTGYEVKPDDLQACHRLKKKETVKFKFGKHKRTVLVDRKNLRNKSENLHQLRFSGKLFVSDSMCHESHQLVYKCRQLKRARKIHFIWFWNNVINVKLMKEVTLTKCFVLLTFKNFLALKVWMKMQHCILSVLISFYVVFSKMTSLPILIIFYQSFF